MTLMMMKYWMKLKNLKKYVIYHNKTLTIMNAWITISGVARDMCRGGHNIYMGGGTNKLQKNGTRRGGYIYIYMGVLREAKGAFIAL